MQSQQQPSWSPTRSTFASNTTTSTSPLRSSPSSKLSSGLRQQQQQQTRSNSSPNSATNPKNLSHVPCKFYRQGTCQAGNACPFSHSNDVVDQAPCKYFQKGNCKFGIKCANAHILPDGRRVNSRVYDHQQQQRQHHSAVPVQASSASQPQSTATASNSNVINNNSSQATSVGSLSTSIPTNSLLSPSTPDRHDESNRAVQSLYQSAYAPDYRTSRSMSSGLPLWKDRSGSSSFARGSLLASSMNESHPTTLTAAAAAAAAAANNNNNNTNATSGITASSSYQNFLNGSAISDDEDEYGEDYVPSSLNELLTPQERQRRGSRSSMVYNYDIWGTGSPRNRFLAQSLPAHHHQQQQAANVPSSSSFLSSARDTFLGAAESSSTAVPQMPIGTPDSKNNGFHGVNHDLSHQSSHNQLHSTATTPAAVASSTVHQPQQRLGIEDDTQFYMEQDESEDGLDNKEETIEERLDKLGL